MALDDQILAWKKRLKRKGPFFLYQEKMDKPYASHEDMKYYYVIWNDGHKTKYGCFYESMPCRYGVVTITVLNGDTKFDLWNGQNIDDDIFDSMLKVRNKESDLPHFNLDELKVNV